jgi:hypothetical protein
MQAFFINCSPLGLDTALGIGIMCKLYLDVRCKHIFCFIYQSLGDKLSLRDKFKLVHYHFCWAWVGTMVHRELEDNYRSEEVR